MRATTFSTILLLAGLGALQLNAQISPARPRIHQALNEARRVSLRGQTHPLAQARFDRGAAPADLPMDRMMLVLKRSPEQQEALDGLLEEQQDPSSANYHQWLTPEEFGRQFGPAEEDVQAVTSWLMSQGFQVDDVAKSRMIIEFSGTAAHVERAFHTQIHKFAVNGLEHWANRTDPEIPEALAPVIDGFTSLHDFHSMPQVAVRDGDPAADALSSPMINMNGGAHWLAPADYATIYNIKPLYTAGINGAGTTIAVVGRSNIDKQDIADFRKLFGLPVNPPIVVLNGPDPGIVKTGAEEIEAVLDVSWSGAVAPGATVKFVVSKSTNSSDGIYLSEKFIIDNNLGDVMTESFGDCEANHLNFNATTNALAQQAAAQGITYLVSTGDSGSAGCDSSSAAKATHAIGVNYLASTPYVIAVGGTEFNEGAGAYWSAQSSTTSGSVLSYIPEKVWNESCDKGTAGCANGSIWATGGGVSTVYAKPSWQAGVPGIPNDGRRDLPDVSLTAAAHDPYILCMGGSCRGSSITFKAANGTSAAAPSFAGILALVKQKAGARLGLANTVLYSLAARQSYSQCNGSAGTPASTCVFNDITVGTNAVPGASGYAAGTGYDMATGLGSVNAFNLVNQWGAGKYAPTVVSLKIAPANIPAGGSATVSITVSPRSGAGKPSGVVTLVTSSGQKIADLTLSLGSVVANISGWPTGTYTVKAHYAGDGAYAPSDSAMITVTAAKAQSAQPEISSVTPGAVYAGQAVTLTVNGSNFQTGLGAFIWVGGTYYRMNTSSVTATQVKIPVTMGGPGPYTAYVFIENPGGLYSYKEFQVN